MAHANESSDDENNLHINDSNSPSKPKTKSEEHSSDEEEEQVLYKLENAQTISQWIQDEGKKKEIVIVDVRDNDYGPSKLKGSIHIPHDKFREDNNIKKFTEANKNVKNIVYHCAQSLSRARNSAQYYAQYRKKKLQTISNTKHSCFRRWLQQFFQSFSKFIGSCQC